MRLCDLRQKEVINMDDCCRLGCVSDIEFNLEKGCITAIIVPGPGHICYFLGRDNEYIIPYNCICQVGEDIILVRINVEECLHKCKY